MEFIYDRAQSDIDDKTSKGYINASDLNRIEGNTETIGAYFGLSLEVKSWETGDLPRASDFLRIRDNVEAIRNAYYILSTTPETPTQPINTYAKWNDIERILYDVHTLYTRNASAYYYTGEMYAGEDIGGSV